MADTQEHPPVVATDPAPLDTADVKAASIEAAPSSATLCVPEAADIPTPIEQPEQREQTAIEESEQSTAVTETLNNWFQTFDQPTILAQFQNYAAFTSPSTESSAKAFVSQMLDTLVTESFTRGGGAVARTAMLFPELVKGLVVSVDDVQECIKSFTKRHILPPATATPQTNKYFGIFYGVVYADLPSSFSLPFLQTLLTPLTESDDGDLSILKILSQVLGTVQVMYGDEKLVSVYKEFGCPLKSFWKVEKAGKKGEVDEAVLNFLEGASLECLVPLQ
ncbi:hypothetical protein HDU79_009966 [Rhizoclosmatium sp. JEL0117]|nr:hypothetical protein HDU79_009966 [Rhizoclosmatium sp. JEL0117]